jgi:hypothetical protein
MDTEKTLKAFFSECVLAGPEICPLANLTGPDTTSATLISTLNFALEALLAKPIPCPELLSYTSIWNPSPATTLYTAVKDKIFRLFYHSTQYPALSAMLYPVMTQNFAEILDTFDGLTESLAADETAAPPTP